MSPPIKVEGRAPHHQGQPSTSSLSNLHATHRDTDPNAQPAETLDATRSQQVSWWSVHEFVTAVLNQVNDWPAAGTPAWCSLANDDPRKWAAVLDGGRHHALRLELNQEVRAAASWAISAAADWPEVARAIQQRNDFHAVRPWMRRKIERTKRC